jgi:hypothetical protein
MTSLARRIALIALVAAAWVASSAMSAAAAPPIPVGCHSDGKCAGLPIDFHTGGAVRSPSPIWAGRWWFVDRLGVAHQGSCTFNRGIHPTYTVPAHRVPQRLPLDPTGARSAYLTWRYGTTTDSLTAAAMWAVLHHYALDAAGGSRSEDPTAPLVARLDRLALLTGRADLQERAIALDREAAALSGPWKVSMRIDRTGMVAVEVRAATRPVPDVPVTVLVSGRDAPLAAATGADGIIRRRVPLPTTPGTVTAIALVTVPGRAEAYQGEPAMPSALGSQTLVTAGPTRRVRAGTSLVITAPTSTSTTMPTSTTSTTTTTTSTTTTTTSTTTTMPTTTTTTSTTATTTSRPTTTTTVRTTIVRTTLPPTSAAALPPPLPRTGGRPDGGIALFATTLLVGGIGVLGTLRRGSLQSSG